MPFQKNIVSIVVIILLFHIKIGISELAIVFLIIANLIDLVQTFLFQNVVAVNEQGDLVRMNDLFLETGGIIAGSIGMGKTTFRFHLMKYLQSIGKQLIDFDYKGETSSRISTPEYSLIPGKNFKINLFDPNLGDPRKFSARLASIIRDNSDELSPAQYNLLNQSLYQTYKRGGTLDDFLCNIFYQGLQFSEEGILGSKYTPLSLYYRISWLFNELGRVFQTDETTHDIFNTKSDMFFDLSYLKHNVSSRNITRLIELILQMLLISTIDLHNCAILIEESQLLYNSSYRGTISEMITTLRHKNVSLYLIGTRFDEFPRMLLDSGSFIQFYSESRTIQHLIPAENQRELKPYQFSAITPSVLRSNLDLLPFRSTIRSNYIQGQISVELTIPEISPTSIRFMIFDGLTQRISFELQDCDYRMTDVTSFEKIERQITQYLKLSPDILPSDLIMTIWINSRQILIHSLKHLAIYDFLHRLDQYLEYLQVLNMESNRHYLLEKLS